MTGGPGSRDDFESPCIRICVVHREAGICTGCLRTPDEIGNWLRLSPDERRAIIADLPGRADLLKRRRGGRRGKIERNGG
ncbi:DUF1289 domain-containing protein [Psychromarinibacter halotolerans]|uniref:DUF1289 domain-containing protein n=1 Tax=Psychromarinibacter halotolerans TaxID=1775175 RepID=A0ABV7GT07_9RHOB|nr:DUF1289 domain-containing protein [Psychromarinibacter halotolerans]MDF0597484.1 DUF1289 domain-containing protein [Psychromarinibacter halotolerans]